MLIIVNVLIDKKTSGHLLATNCRNIVVVINFLSQVISVFLLYLGLVMYANEVEKKEK